MITTIKGGQVLKDARIKSFVQTHNDIFQSILTYREKYAKYPHDMRPLFKENLILGNITTFASTDFGQVRIGKFPFRTPFGNYTANSLIFYNLSNEVANALEVNIDGAEGLYTSGGFTDFLSYKTGNIQTSNSLTINNTDVPYTTNPIPFTASAIEPVRR